MKLKNKRVLAAAAVIIIVVIFLGFRLFHKKSISIVYKTTKVDRGDILSYVAATGTVNPVTTIEIGSQISGIINGVYVDFNSQVKKGQTLAEIDQTPFIAQVKQSEADLKKTQVDSELTEKIMKANEELYKKGFISKQEYDDSKAKFSSATAALDQAKAKLDTAKSNLQSTIIRSPIDGIVISKNINVGQTVTLGNQSPPIFLIAGDLVKMQLDTNVSEADIGRIKQGEEASFTVDAYPNQTFKGTVWQIRNSPIITQNVVTYDVVLLMDNKDLKLKPGMTADVKILVAYRKDTLRVPRAALRFIPPPSANLDEKSNDTNNSSVIWVMSRNKRLKHISIKPGISDDSFTEVLDGDIKEGEETIVEAAEKGASDSQPLGPIVLPQPQRF
jgi:HlyD family secretion protein